MKTHDKIKSTIAVIDHEIAHLSSVFSTYKRLYVSDEETRKLLGETDSAFFGDLYIVYLNYIAVAVSRLLDPATTGKKANLTIFTLINLLKDDGHSEADELKERLKEIKTKAYNFTEPRNQLVSHLDYDVNNNGSNSKAIPSFVTSEFDSFYEDVGVLMNDIRIILDMSPYMYEWGIVGHGSGRKLLHRIQSAADDIKKRSEQGAASDR
ncbi:hypothetical protein JIN77_16630 [Verrucomicrobiaceae bacterium R5-34]|nr:hypothetical protein [Verrucomicrobiaceae bacterium R5-34]